jgi:hypothetical protein
MDASPLSKSNMDMIPPSRLRKENSRKNIPSSKSVPRHPQMLGINNAGKDPQHYNNFVVSTTDDQIKKQLSNFIQ